MGHTRFNLYKQMDAVAVSGTTNYTSPTTDMSQQHNIGLDIRFTGTMTGTLSVNASNDGVVFSALTFDPVLGQPAGSDLNYVIDLNQFPFKYLQVSYLNASGSGTLTSILSSKDLG